MKRILMVLDAYYPNDIRVRKEAEALIRAGYDLSLLCYRREGEPINEVMDGVMIIRTQKAITKSKKGFLDIFNSLTFKNYAIDRALNQIKENFDVLHAHDLAVANTVLNHARKKGIPCVLDLHENYPEALKTWFEWRKSRLIQFKNKLFFKPDLWMRREYKMIHEFDRVIAVVEEMRARLIEVHKVKPEKITVVSNSEPSDLFESLESDENVRSHNELVYVGGIGPHRGLDDAIRGLKELVKRGETIKLKIVGSGNADNVNHLKELAVSLELDDWVEFTGQVPYKEAISYMQGAFLNIIPHKSNNHTDNTIPHKLFQILNSGYPLLVSSSRPLKRIVEKYDAGLVFEAGNPISFADVVMAAKKMPEELKWKAENGRAATISKGLNWETDSKALISLYQEL